MRKLNWRSLGLVVLMLFSANTFAVDLGDIIKIISNAGNGGGRPEWGRPGRPEWPGRPGRPDRPGRDDRYVVCHAEDNGWEEHRGGHQSCFECLSYHDGCTETCERIDDQYECIFDGRRPDGRTLPFTGVSADRRTAENDAENQCYRAGFRDCRYVRCDRRSNSDVISQGQCRGGR